MCSLFSFKYCKDIMLTSGGDVTVQTIGRIGPKCREDRGRADAVQKVVLLVAY